MAARFILSRTPAIFLFAGLALGLTACGSVSRSGFLPPPRLPADAPPLQSTATVPNDAGIPVLSAAAPRLPGALPPGALSPGAISQGALPGVDAILARLDELDSRISGLQEQFQAAAPAISRLTRIDGDIRALLTQMEGAVAARAEDAPVAKAVTSNPDGRPGRAPNTALTMATPIGPLVAPPLAAPSLTAPSPSLATPPAAPSTPPLALSDPGGPGGPRLSLSPGRTLDTPAPPPPPAQPQQPAPSAMPAALTAAIHLASYRSIESARDGWRILQRRYPAELGTLVPMVLAVELGVGRGRMLRLQGSALTRDEARTLCDRLKKAGQYCIPAVDAGTPLNRAGTPVASLR